MRYISKVAFFATAFLFFGVLPAYSQSIECVFFNKADNVTPIHRITAKLKPIPFVEIYRYQSGRELTYRPNIRYFQYSLATNTATFVVDNFSPYSGANSSDLRSEEFDVDVIFVGFGNNSMSRTTAELATRAPNSTNPLLRPIRFMDKCRRLD